MTENIFKEKNKLLLEDIWKLAKEFKEWFGRRWLICSHYDADGLSSAGIISRLLYGSDSEFTCRILDHLSTKELNEAKSFNSDVYVFLDMGSSELNALSKLSKQGKVFVIDHHQFPRGVEDIKGVEVLNPEIYGINGAKIGCTSVLTSLLAYHASEQKDTYYLKMGVVGLIGDLQTEKENSVNELLIKEALKKKALKKYKTFTFFKLAESPIHKGICWNFEPYIPGLTGEEGTVVSLLTSANIKLKNNDEWRKIRDLTEEEKMIIAEKLMEYISHKIKSINLKTSDFLETVYEFEDEESLFSTANSFASVLNACGKMKKAHLAVLVSMGIRSRNVTEEIKKVVEERKLKLREQIGSLKEREEILGRILVLDGRGIIDESFTGSVATMYSLSPAYKGKVVLVLAETSEKEVKVSARAPKELTDAGLNLGKLMFEISRSLGGVGGGHDVAAGATIPLNKVTFEIIRDKIVQKVAEEVKRIGHLY